MSEITIVTAFFDIGRGSWPGRFQRNADRYIENFKFWARIRNRMIIYTQQECFEKIWKVRNEFGLADKTEIIVIDDILQIDPEIYNKMQLVLSNPIAIKFRKRPKNPECHNAKYNYLTILKAWFIRDAVQRKITDDMIAWIDFGYNHGGKYYTQPEEFDFTWKYDFTKKIHFFALNPLDDIPIFELVKTMKTYFSAGFFIVPEFLADVLWESFKAEMGHLLACGMCDDEQTIMLMSYREKKELFEVHHIDEWFEPWKKHGGEHLSVEHAKKGLAKVVYKWKMGFKRIFKIK